MEVVAVEEETRLCVRHFVRLVGPTLKLCRNVLRGSSRLCPPLIAPVIRRVLRVSPRCTFRARSTGTEGVLHSLYSGSHTALNYILRW